MSFFSFFFFNDTATTEIYTLSLHDALPISRHSGTAAAGRMRVQSPRTSRPTAYTSHASRVTTELRGYEKWVDRKSTRLNSSHANISYAVFCLKKKKIIQILVN